ncbi:MAG: hypothetical protein QHJ34_13710 [bacterium]|jgi:hypothetical protein|nr:hypothetical protein [candidate division KSB1 bacterium]MDH7561268.1 hypothetical protein [bacterium]
MRAATIAVFSQLIGAALSLAAPQLAGRVTGLGHRPVSDATVVLLPDFALARTDCAGCYTLRPPGPGGFLLHVSAPHMLAERRQVRVDRGSAVLDVQLVPGDENADGRLDLWDAIALVQRLGPVAANDPLDADGDSALSVQDLEAWYDTCWQAEGHWRSFVLLDDAEHTGPAVVYPPQGRWQTHKDQGSTTLPAPGVAVGPSAGGYLSSRAYQFRYVLGSTVQYPFALIRFLFGQNDQVTFDARGYEGLIVALRGEGQPLIVSLKAAVTSDDWAEYFVRIPEVSREWRVYEFDFRQDFHQPSWGQREGIDDVLDTLQAVQFKADEASRDRAVTLWIDNLLLYGRLYEPPSTQVRVRLTEQGQPLPAAVVTIDGLDCRRRALSDLRGEVLFPAVPAGSYLLWAWRPGYASDTLALQVEGQERLDVGPLAVRRLVPVPKPLSCGPVRVANGRLEVDFDGDTVYEPFVIKGVGYSPVPIGSWGDLVYPERVYARDMPLLHTMNCNAIRTWGKAEQLLLDQAGLCGIKVLAGFWVSTEADFFAPRERMAIIEEFERYVRSIKDHQALLAWSLGNEQNLTNGDNWAWYSLVEDLAVTAFLAEGASYHPVACPNGDRTRIGLADYLARDSDLPYLDMWGMNLYKSDREGFGPTFLLYSAFSSKPLWISEYGIDAYDNRNHREYELTQAVFAKNRLLEMRRHPFCIGATLMAYSDEWWKAGDPWSHDLGGYASSAHPDGFSNEEWWGIFRVSRRAGDIDSLAARAIFDTLRVYFR